MAMNAICKPDSNLKMTIGQQRSTRRSSAGNNRAAITPNWRAAIFSGDGRAGDPNITLTANVMSGAQYATKTSNRNRFRLRAMSLRTLLSPSRSTADAAELGGGVSYGLVMGGKRSVRESELRSRRVVRCAIDHPNTPPTTRLYPRTHRWLIRSGRCAFR